MSRILEFQPTDEHTVITRVLMELHQAIDINFPGVKASARQFTKTVLTNQGESTRVDNVPASSPSRSNSEQPIGDPSSEHVSMTPKSEYRSKQGAPALHTADIRTLLGESSASRRTKKILLLLLLIGIGVFVWLNYFRDTFPIPSFLMNGSH